ASGQLRTPVRAPIANAFAERFVRTVRSECRDHGLVYGHRHLEWVLRAHVTHYMEERPQQRLGLATPLGRTVPVRNGGSTEERRDTLGGSSTVPMGRLPPT